MSKSEKTMIDHNEVRVVESRFLPATPPARTKYQARRDQDLQEVEEALRLARELVDDALEGFGMYTQPQHPHLSTLIGQLIEQVIEFRRVQG